MARIEFAPEVVDDFDRIVDHLASHDASRIGERITEIVQAIDILQTSPRIGRPASGALRELVIGQGAHGYVALYRYEDVLDVVFVLAIRNQREAGYRDR